MKKIISILIFLFAGLTANSQCSAVPWSPWGFATPCVVGSGYYNTGCVVSYDDGGGLRNYTAKAGPHHSNVPATGGTAYWTDNGLCGGDPPTLAATTSSDDDCMFATVTGQTLTIGGSDINERGFVWNTSGTPTIGGGTKVVYDYSNTIGSYTTDIEVDEYTTVYIRSYAINTDGDEGYGNQVTITTDKSPTVTNVNAINIFCESMSFESSTNPKGQLNGAGIGTATNVEFGFFYGISSDAVDAARPNSYAGCSKEVHIARTGKGNSMTQIIRRSEVTGLTPNTKYYYKSYTTTDVCTGYGPRKDATTDVTCPVYYSCSGAATYDTDPTCPDANLTPTAKSIVYFRHDWRLTPGTKLADLGAELPNQPVIGITPYRIVMEQGGYAYTTGALNAGTQVVLNTGGQFGYEGSPQIVVDGLTSAGLKFARITMNGGSFVVAGSLTNLTAISSGTGEICYEGSWINNADAPGSVYGNYTAGGGLTDTRYTDANCVGIFTLPVELISFTAKRHDGKYVTYNWVTGSEINNDHFELELSIDANTWERVGTVNGMGNTMDVTTYDFDVEIDKKYKFTRLKQVDFDGTYSYSNIVFVGDEDTSTEIVLIKNGIFITSEDTLNLDIYNMSGIRVTSAQVPSGQNTIRFNNLSNGLYVIRVESDSFKVLIKN